MADVLTRRKLLFKRQSFLIETIESAQKGYAGLVSGEISSYTLGTWTVSRSKPDLDKLQKAIQSMMIELDAINNILSGRSARKVTTCIYNNPQSTRWWDII